MENLEMGGYTMEIMGNGDLNSFWNLNYTHINLRVVSSVLSCLTLNQSMEICSLLANFLTYHSDKFVLFFLLDC